MASIVELNKKNTMPLASAIDRQFAIPVDSTLVWYDYDELVAYAQSNATTAYVGQIVAYIDQAEHKAYAYIIQEDGTLGEIGGSAAKNVDGISVELNEDGIIGLYGYGKQYYKYRPASGVQGSADYVESGYDLTDGWIAGLEPRVVAQGGKMVLGWYEPSTETIDGLNSAIGSLNTQVSTLRGDITDLNTVLAGDNGLVGRVENLESTVKDIIGAFVFKGVVAKYSDLTAIANPQNGWVYKVTDTEAEYAYDGSNWIELGTIYEVDLSDYVTTTQLNNAIGSFVTGEELLNTLGDYVTETDFNNTLNTTLVDYVTEEDFTKLAGRVGTLEGEFEEGGKVANLITKVASLESLLDPQDGLPAQVELLRETVGVPASEDEEATGLFKLIDDIDYVAKIKIGETVVEPDENRQIAIPVFGDAEIGLVPSSATVAGDNINNYFLNGAAQWAIPTDARIGELTYKNAQYETVEAYIAAYVADHELVWEAI